MLIESINKIRTTDDDDAADYGGLRGRQQRTRRFNEWIGWQSDLRVLVFVLTGRNKTIESLRDG